MNRLINGELEIDEERGVIYFHIGNEAIAEFNGVVTLLRIQNLPLPLPRKGLIDITYPKEVKS